MKDTNANNSFLYSVLVSMNNIKNHEITEEDIKYMNEKDVSKCQIVICKQVIVWLSQGKSYEEIGTLIDELDFEDYQKLTEEKQQYLKKRLKKDLNSRKLNEKIKGEMKNE